MSYDVRHYLSLPYAETVAPEVTTAGSVAYVARNPELDGCEAHGGTPAEALANLREARELYLRSMLEDGLEPPLPAAAELGAPAAMRAVMETYIPQAERRLTSRAIPFGGMPLAVS